MDMDGLSLNITLDCIKFKGDPGYDLVKQRPLPRCVGGDKSLTQNLLKRLNRTFLHDRNGENFLCCSKKEQVTGTIDYIGKPIAVRRGEPLVEGFGFGMFDEGPGVVQGHAPNFCKMPNLSTRGRNSFLGNVLASSAPKWGSGIWGLDGVLSQNPI